LPAKEQPTRKFTDATAAEIIAIGTTPNLTGAERSRLFAPYVGKWLRVEGLVEDVHAPGHLGQLTVNDETGKSLAMAYFRDDVYVGRVTALRKGARVKLVGRLNEVSGLWGVTLDDCELLD
jgi:hypothetical protein